MFWLAIAVGGALGAVARFALSHQTYLWLGKEFAWGTLAVNVIGSFFMGLLTILLINKFAVSPEWKALIIVGFLGSFTTFSTFSYESLQFIQTGEWAKAALNIFVSVMACLIAVGIGLWVGKQFLVE
ncbi:fluoride efflux transporter CrcB [Thiomicrospira microaerophila]|uniref:fluoride efflux transporter CrcB n=1 Tax=Thiomicrospira microaerophila TaxID=406020 RepID=UPI00200FFEC0|nr:fluoride efflux transporter CrcB [Thiomicrospira microaerophila]UQB43227.1 fluoride efflux transporter CrcB [Thiomicrospira microaerophila]